MDERLTALRSRPRGRRRALVPGDRIGDAYRLEERLDEGGMAEVFRARDERTGQPCAVKVLHAELGGHGDILALFAKEARIGEVIGPNPHIVDVLDAGVDSLLGAPFIVMELLEGETLEHALARGPLTRDDARTVLVQIANALDHAHRSGVVHRDLKPSNLFLTRTPQGELRVKVMDFGIAKLLEDGAMRTATQVGTPAYTAPEQMGATTRRLAERQGITIARGVSPATDVWALGLIAYELYTGEAPGHYWRFETLTELPMKVAFEDLAPATVRAGTRAALLPPGFDAWFDRCLRKDARERWPSAGDAVAALLALEAGSSWHAEWPQPSGPSRVGNATVFAHPYTIHDAHHSPTGRPHMTAPQERPSWTWRRVTWIAALALGCGAVASGFALVRSAGTESACLQPSPEASTDATDAACEAACARDSVASCWRRAQRGRADGTSGSESASSREWLLKACGIDEVPSARGAARRTWLETVARNGCPTDHCVARACVELADDHVAGQHGASRDEDLATALYKRSCRLDSAGDATNRGVDGCVGLGRQRQNLNQPDAARAYYGAACDGGVPKGCVALGALLTRLPQRDNESDKQARTLFERACGDGDLEGCARLGRLVELGRGGWTRDESEAVTLYRRACDGGAPIGCVSLAHSTAQGRGGLPRDPVTAAELRSRACQAGDALGCAALADMVLRGEGGLERDEKKAFSLNRDACERGALLGCAQWGRMYLEGLAGLAPDARQGRALLSRACDGGEPEGCVALAHLELEGPTPDPERIDAWLQRACDTDAPEACVRLGTLLEEGASGLARDPTRAGRLYQRGCDEGALRGCTQLGNLTYLGEGGLDRDFPRSVELNERACRGGDAVGCARLGVLHALGHGTPRDPVRASELYREACTGAQEENRTRCTLLQKLLASPRVVGARVGGTG